ncbi:MAG: SRPBCC family protein [Parvularculaceae bacterium]
MENSEPLIAPAGMLIRRPVFEVFEAFVDPAITTKFWFTKSSGRLEPGKTVRWDWEMYGVSAEVIVRAVEKDARILIDWPASEGRSSVEWTFTPTADGSTFVSIRNTGFPGDARQVAEQAIDSAGGFALVVAGLKALLEHGVELNLVRDRFPAGLVEH